MHGKAWHGTECTYSILIEQMEFLSRKGKVKSRTSAYILLIAFDIHKCHFVFFFCLFAGPKQLKENSRTHVKCATIDIYNSTKMLDAHTIHLAISFQIFCVAQQKEKKVGRNEEERQRLRVWNTFGSLQCAKTTITRWKQRIPCSLSNANRARCCYFVLFIHTI